MDSQASEFFERLLRLPYNKKCADCEQKQPAWASVTYSVFICYSCAAKHRQLGTNISRVKSITMDQWSIDEIRRMAVAGNKYAIRLPSTDNFRERYTEHGPYLSMIDSMYEKSCQEEPGDSFMKKGMKLDEDFSGSVEQRSKPKFGSRLRRYDYVPEDNLSTKKDSDVPEFSVVKHAVMGAAEHTKPDIVEEFKPIRSGSVVFKPRPSTDHSRSPFSLVSFEKDSGDESG